MLTNLDWESSRQLQGDKVPQLGEVSVAGGHQVDDGKDLFLQGQREVLAQPQRRLELLDLGGLLDGAADVPLAQVHQGVEVLLWRDGGRVVRHCAGCLGAEYR